MNPLEEYKQLVQKMKEYAEAYYSRGESLIPDELYDAYFKDLLNSEAKLGYVDSDSPTQKVGAPVSSTSFTHKHAVPMLSLSNALNLEQLRDKIDTMLKATGASRTDKVFVVEYKYDGIACGVTYIDGKLHHAVTRGDGLVGEDITRHVRHIKQVPGELSVISRMDFHGEIVLPKDNLAIANAIRVLGNEKPFVNTRNAVAGIVRKLISNPAIASLLSFRIYGAYSKTIDSIKLLDDVYPYIGEITGIPSSYFEVVSANEIEKYLAKITLERADLAIDIDGVVIKYNDRAKQKEMGSTATGPRWAFAYKFQPERVESLLLGVDYQVGRTGLITPVARVEPVAVGGVVVTNPNLHNEGKMQALDLHYGDTLVITRRGDVIPQIEEVVKSKRLVGANPVLFTAICPSCASLLVKRGARFYCESIYCQDQAIAQLTYAFDKPNLNVVGFARATAEHLVKHARITKVSDVIVFTADDFAQKAGVGKLVGKKLFDALQKAKTVTAQKFLRSFGIHLVGDTTSRALATHYTDLGKIPLAPKEELQVIPDVGVASAEAIVEYFSNPNHTEEYYLLMELLNVVAPQLGGKLTGQSFATTGTLSGMTRDEFEDIVKSNGGKIDGGVSKLTNYLVCEGDSNSKKYTNAKKFGTTILTAAEFRAYLDGLVSY